MSLILDALKKLEREKAASRKSSVDIVPAIISSRVTRRWPAGWKLPVVIIVVIALTAAVTTAVVFLLAPRGNRPAPAASASAENITPAPPSLAPGNQANPKLAAEPAKVPSVIPSRTVPAETLPGRIQSHESKPFGDKNDDSVQSAGGGTDLKVSGIAWQDDRAERRAVVNGALVGEGAVVEGARIVRIFQDKVRFSRSGETFEITVAGSPQAK
ncbi:MAG TPA: hypothetical protein VFG19_00530 [Geobacteraceae bacterium]|nr:hypothetical protein [Geobacteraceae bacterium]